MNRLAHISKQCQRDWDELGNIPIADDPVSSAAGLDAPFKHFAKGALLDDVWRWIERTHSVAVAELQGVA